MSERELQEHLLDSWICANSMLKDSKMTSELTYNEAIVMRMVYSSYEADGRGIVSVKSIIKSTNMLKSLANRTIDSLCEKGLLAKEQDPNDKRSLNVRIVPENLETFERVHEHSLEIANKVLHIIGNEDAEAFIRSCKKLREAGLDL